MRMSPDDPVTEITGRKKSWPVPDKWLPSNVERLWDSEHEPQNDNTIDRNVTRNRVDRNSAEPEAVDPQRRGRALQAIRRFDGSVDMGLDGRVSQVNLGSSKVTDDDLVLFKALPFVKVIQLDRTQVTGAGLVHLSGLTELTNLRLYDTHVDDAGLVHLKRFSKLHFLMLKRTNVTNVGAEMLQSLLPDCTISWSQR